MIFFDKENATFYLHTNKTSYAFSILKNKYLTHIYWGKRINSSVVCDFNEEFECKNTTAVDIGDYSSDILPSEYSTYGHADLRMPAFTAKYADGSRVSELYYNGYDIIKGKPKLEGLPSTYCEDGDNVQTLIIHLHDNLKNVDVDLNYSVFEDFNAITRSAKIVNNGERMSLLSALSMSVDFYGMADSDIITLDGAWAKERSINRRGIVCGNQNIESRVGASSSYHNPFMAICDKSTTENFGNVYGFSLVYSGNFTSGVEVNAYGCGRAYIGINPFGFEWVLEEGERFTTPEAVLIYSDKGLGGMSRIYHKFYRTRLCRGKYRDIDRFILINNWEATYFDFTEEKIVDIAKKASTIGIDTMVLDDGWFGKRINDTAGLGDWVENLDKLPKGIDGLANKINALGMHFGLWFEPEMVNPDSDLFKAHPDWILNTKGRVSSTSRNQFTLDLTRKDVCDYIINCVSYILNKANIEYVKWDMNRYFSEAGSTMLSPEKQGEVPHRYMLGLYNILETLTQKFPNVLFECCASGGGRFDPGMLYFMPQTWTSDDSDAVERQMIQYGTSMVYPYSSMGAHVSACPNHQTGRTTTFEMRCNVAMPGQFGFELDLNKCSEEEISIAQKAIAKYRRLQRVFHNGDLYRLVSPFEKDYTALEFISENKNTVIVCIDSKKATPNANDEFIPLQGLDTNAIYKSNGVSYGGDVLMGRGLHFRNCFPYGATYELKSLMIEFTKE